jgi:hypothetical protein
MYEKVILWNSGEAEALKILAINVNYVSLAPEDSFVILLRW